MGAGFEGLNAKLNLEDELFWALGPDGGARPEGPLGPPGTLSGAFVSSG